MKQADTQNKPFSKKAAALIIFCIVLVAAVAIIGANWDLIFPPEKALPEDVDATVSTHQDSGIMSEFPWENGGKQPEEYTWSEFLALPAEQQGAFADTFINADAFMAWQRVAIDKDDTLELPWKNGGKQPEEYTWEDFLALSPSEQDLFYLAFPTIDDYHQWLEQADP